MESPMFIIKNGANVTYTKRIKGEPVEFTGKVIGNGLDRCLYRSNRDLTYIIKEDDTDNIHEIHHEDVCENIFCKNCQCDILIEGVDEQVWRTTRFNHKSKKQVIDIAPIVDCDAYQCAYCQSEIDIETVNKLRKYLDI